MEQVRNNNRVEMLVIPLLLGDNINFGWIFVFSPGHDELPSDQLAGLDISLCDHHL
jgi:hypothetical protein